MSKLLVGLYKQRDSLNARIQIVRDYRGFNLSREEPYYKLCKELEDRLRAVNESIEIEERRDKEMAAGFGIPIQGEFKGSIYCHISTQSKPRDDNDTGNLSDYGYFEGEPYREYFNYKANAWILEYGGQAMVLTDGKRAADGIREYKRLYGDKEARDKHERAMGRAVEEKTADEVTLHMRQMGLQTAVPVPPTEYEIRDTKPEIRTTVTSNAAITLNGYATSDMIVIDSYPYSNETDLEWLDRRVNEVTKWQSG